MWFFCGQCRRIISRIEFAESCKGEHFICKKCNNEIDIIEDATRIITREKRYIILKRQGWHCNNCGIKLKYSADSSFQGEVAHIDHIHPFSKRETYLHFPWNINEESNLQALCEKCNRAKWSKLQ